MGGGWMFEEKNLGVRQLAAEMTELFENPERLAKAATAAAGAGRADGAERLADLIDEVAGSGLPAKRRCRANWSGRSRRMKMSRDIGALHFVGIGGIGMSGIAEALTTLGYRVQGSDVVESANVQRLREKNIPVAIGHTAANLGDAEVVVVSSAIGRDNPELKAARERLLPVVRRAEMLAELMRLKSAIAVGGTHGKTTTTSLVAALLDAGGLDPTVINGGIINAYGSNARMGDGDWMVVEADESDGTFVKLPADIAIVTNIDPEHLDHYGTFDRVRDAFRQFVENVTVSTALR